MIFSEKKVAFGRHETFQLRYSWLTKGFLELKKNPKIFSSDDATVKLGVGKNMVNSIRYWLQAAQIVTLEKGEYKITPLGESIFGDKGFDTYLEDEATIWLVHWLLTSNPAMATSWYWYFNYFHKPEFTNKDVVDSLHSFAKQHIVSKFTLATLKKDVDIILRMYSHSKVNTKQSIEDSLDSPLSLLNLVSHLPDIKSYYSFPEERNKIPLGVIGFAVMSVFEEIKSDSIPIENLMYMKGKHPALGAIFRMTESSLLAKLELLARYIPNTLEMREDAGIHQLHRLEKRKPIEYLKKHYNDEQLKVAA
ncbi:MAG: Unknown protein [uncultured Thiotrichaceae bacterium]|uniref:DUF4007 domain-containing protein n=1 Tax=uncultured Thiotrichaceae bacterium TaxID=298394 RepID=A0A6S6UAK8_9GAMM|nr:MAG: Unknown protein [uncultured Thiotrichaceae bacterium]